MSFGTDANVCERTKIEKIINEYIGVISSTSLPPPKLAAANPGKYM